MTRRNFNLLIKVKENSVNNGEFLKKKIIFCDPKKFNLLIKVKGNSVNNGEFLKKKFILCDPKKC